MSNGDTFIAAVGRDKSKEEQINAIVDAVHWQIQTKGTTGKLHVMIGKRKNSHSMA